MSSISPSRVTGIRPLWGLEGSRILISGSGFPVEPPPEVIVGGVAARLATASPRELKAIVPPGLDGGSTPVRLECCPGETIYLEIGAPLATGLHQVDNPVFDSGGNLFVTFSGSRGQETPVSIYRVRPDGSREPFVTGLPNPTSMAIDPAGQLHVSSRFDGSVYRVDAEGIASVIAADLGVACGIAFDRDGTLFVGDRSGSILRVAKGRASTFATLPASVAAFHLAFAPDGALFVTAPTLATCDCVYRIAPSGNVEIFYEGFGRPQGIAFDRHGRLYVVDALAGSGGLYRFDVGSREPEMLIGAGGLVGLAFTREDAVAVASADTVYRFAASSNLV